MKITVEKGLLENQTCDLLIVNAFKDWKKLGGATEDVNKATQGLLQTLAKEDSFTGEKGQQILIHPAGFSAKRILLIGLGEEKTFDLNVVRDVSALGYQVAKKLGAKRVVSILHGTGYGKLSPKDGAQAQTEGVRLAEYEYTKLKKTTKTKTVDAWHMVCNDAVKVRQAKKGIELAELTSRGICFARDLVNEPAQTMNPQEMVRVAKQLVKESGGLLKIKVLGAAEIKKAKMGGLYGVGQGSDAPPQFIHLQYKHPKAKTRVSLVGKGITFDSGGYSIKPGNFMENMKCDMAGAAAVLGVFSVLTQLEPKLHVDGIIGAAENMVSGNAIRPGDVLTARNGKTMEVLNTDAEGRLTLADSLSYACELKPAYVIDLATLTGACMVALGEEVIGLMGNDEKLREKLMESSLATGEKMWPLPLEQNYKKLLKSKIADIKNIGGRYGGALTAGLFLEEFVEESIPWAHLDIAGPAFAERTINPYTQYGGTGSGVATLLQFLRSL